jgi:hypothetical protein
MANKLKKIPKEKIEEGIQLSLKKSSEHLDGANALIEKNLLDDSVAMIEFGIEEFGRAVILREMLNEGRETVKIRAWKNHDFKYKRAFLVLPLKTKTIWEQTVPYMSAMIAGRRMGALSARNVLGYPHRKEMETISPEARINAIFIDYDEETQRWQNGVRANDDKLKLVIADIRENIATFKF